MTDFQHTFVELIPDLIEAGEYDRYPDGKLVRLRISVTPEGVDVLADGLRPEIVEEVLRVLGAGPMQQMLCG